MAHQPSESVATQPGSARRRFLGMAGVGAAAAGVTSLVGTSPAGAITPAEVQTALTRAVGLDPVDHGAVGDGVADDTVALQAAIDAAGAPGGVGIGAGVVVLGPGTYRITDTLTLDQQAIRFVGHGVGNVHGYGPKSGNGSTIVWDGTSGADMFDVIDSAFCEWSDIWFTSKDTKPAGAAIHWRNPGSATVGTNAQLQVNRCRIDYHPWSAGTNDEDIAHFAYGVRISGDNTNNDQFAIQDSVISRCSVAGISVENSQSIWGHIFNTFVGRSPKGIHMRADCTLYNLQFNRNGTDLHVEANPTVSVTGFNSEGAEQPVVLNGGSGTGGGRLAIRGGRIRLSSAWVDAGSLPMVDCTNHQGGVVSLSEVLVDMGVPSTAPTIKARMHDDSTRDAAVAVRHCAGLSPANIDARCDSLPSADATMLVDVDSGGEKTWTVLHDGETFDSSARPIDFADPGISNQAATANYTVVADDADTTIIRYLPGTTTWPSDADADIAVGTVIRHAGAIAAVEHLAGTGATVVGQTHQSAGGFSTAVKWAANSWILFGSRETLKRNSQGATAYTMELRDMGSVLELTNGGPITVTVPNSSSVAWPDGEVLEIQAQGTGTVTVVAAPGVTIESLGGATELAGQHAGARLRYRGSNVWHLTGQLV